MPQFRVGKPRLALQLASPGATYAPGFFDVEWGVVAYEDPSIWSPLAPAEFIVPKTGLWLTNLVQLLNKNDASSTVYFFLTRNGNDLFTILRNNGQGQEQGSDCWFGELDAGDVLKWSVFNASTDDLFLQDGVYNEWQITRIGPERWT